MHSRLTKQIGYLFQQNAVKVYRRLSTGVALLLKKFERAWHQCLTKSKARIREVESNFRTAAIKWWNNQKTNLAWFLGLLLLAPVCYAISWTLRADIKHRELIGITLQLLAGAVFSVDQIFSKDEFRQWVKKATQNRNKLALLIVIVGAIVGILLTEYYGNFNKVTIAVIPGTLFAALFLPWSYLQLLEWVKKAWKKMNRGNNPNLVTDLPPMALVNFIVFMLSLVANVGAYFFILWLFRLAFFHWPILGVRDGIFLLHALGISIVLAIIFMVLLFAISGFYLSALYLVVRGVIQVVLWANQKQKWVWWICFLVVWIWGGALLLLNVF